MDQEPLKQNEAMSGGEYHRDAIENNERGNSLGALMSADRAMLSYKLEGKQEFVAMFAVRSLILRRVAKEQDNDEYLIAAKHDSEAGLEIGRRGGYPTQMSTLLYHHGKVLVDLKKYDEAVGAFQEALDNLHASSNNKKSFESEIRANLETTKRIMGDESAEERALQAISEIEQSSDATPHEKNVWMAGGYMRLAQAVFSKDRNKAMEYMTRANQIIERDPMDLMLLKKDWDRLRSTLQ